MDTLEQLNHYLPLIAKAYSDNSPRVEAEGGRVAVSPLWGGFNNIVYKADIDGVSYCYKLYIIDERHRAEREYNTLCAFRLRKSGSNFGIILK